MSVTTQNSKPLREDDHEPTTGAFHIEDVYPCINGGRFPVKRVAGDEIEVWADVFRGGHDLVGVDLVWRPASQSEWHRTVMTHHENDRWVGRFTPVDPGHYVYAIEAWTDEFGTWKHGFELKQNAGQDITLDLLEGAALLTRAQYGSEASSKIIVRQCEAYLETGNSAALMNDELFTAMSESQKRADLTRSQLFPLVVDRERGVAGAWYEMIPRSQSKVHGRHGTFRDCIERLPEIAAMGFDVLYLTPVHPIGVKNRKGRNNSLKAQPGDPGSFYAIGSADGGHDSLHPELGTMEDFRALIDACKSHGMEVAMDIAVQCSPDHPWLEQHPEWFKRRPDGSMKYAENPPKRYEDIVNPDFDCDDASSLWNALRDVFLFWVDKGVRIFRIDNPHTKPFHFWEWVIKEVQARDAGVVFLAEAFTRPKLMKGLAKLGFTQSYTYFTWRTKRWEIEAYLNELTGYPECDYYRTNFFVNTPDILPYHLQGGESWMFKSRAALAATLSASYGIYNGFELLEHEAIPGKEEYLDSEKYEIKTRDWNSPGNIKAYITDLNYARKSNPALLQNRNLRFLTVDNDNVIGFVKTSTDGANTVVIAIALSRETSEVWIPLGDIQLSTSEGFKMPVVLENVLTRERHPVEWNGIRLRIDPLRNPAFIFRCLA